MHGAPSPGRPLTRPHCVNQLTSMHSMPYPGRPFNTSVRAFSERPTRSPYRAALHGGPHSVTRRAALHGRPHLGHPSCSPARALARVARRATLHGDFTQLRTFASPSPCVQVTR